MAEYFTSKVSTVSKEKPSKYKQLKTVEASTQDDHVLRDSYPLSTPGSQGFPPRGSSPRTTPRANGSAPPRPAPAAGRRVPSHPRGVGRAGWRKTGSSERELGLGFKPTLCSPSGSALAPLQGEHSPRSWQRGQVALAFFKRKAGRLDSELPLACTVLRTTQIS